MFPLGPKEDAEGIVESLGNLLDSAPPRNDFISKWRPVLKKLFSPGKWDVMAFRVLITPFYLSRNVDSTWYGRFIIDRSIARPRPYIVLPSKDSATAEMSEAFRDEKRKKNRDGLIDIGALRLRSDEMKYTAWCTLFRQVSDTIKGAPGAARHHAMQAVLDSQFTRTKPSARVVKLVGLIKTIVNAGERFIIVTDRIWNAMVAMKVQFSYIALIERHVSQSRLVSSIALIERLPDRLGSSKWGHWLDNLYSLTSAAKKPETR
jgi:hypothetical protein